MRGRRLTKPFLQVPPFPGARGLPLVLPGTSKFDHRIILEALIANRVGGAFWAAPVKLDADCDLILVPDSAEQLDAMLGEAGQRQIAIVPACGMRPRPGRVTLTASCDPWNLAEQAREVWADADSTFAFIAAVLGKPVRLFSKDRPAPHQPELVGDLLQSLAANAYASPFDGVSWPLIQVIEQLGEWRRLIDSNRCFRAVYGVARWKRVTVDPLLWDGTGPVRHARRAITDLAHGTPVVAWKSRTCPAALAGLQATGAAIAELEDGMIRSVGLGANCVPPLSVVVDNSGIYFDPNSESDLESLLQCGELPPRWVERAAGLIRTLVNAGISKYGSGHATTPVTHRQGRRILVTGQVEDDRSVLSGGDNCTNLTLLAKARAIEPEAWIIYKPHPDVEAGHRKGHVPDGEALRFANTIDRKSSITALLDQVDGLHVITSLAGFEALLRGKDVTTHGQPFYAGWGLTRDLGPPNPRRTQRRNLGELVAATLIGYPRYIDPVSRLPCPPEVLVGRIANGQARVTSLLILLREWQGQLRLLWKRLAGGPR